MTVDVVVMAHPARAEHALKLAAEIDARIVWDQRNDEWHTGARAWSAINPAADRGLVVQDDALPIPDFRRHVDTLAARAPRTAVSLYVGTGRPREPQVRRAVTEADRTGASWLDCDGLLWGVAIMLPVEHITPLLDCAQTSPLPYDQRISAWYRSRGQRVRHCWPSMVDHTDGPRLADTGGTPTAPRHAWHVGPPNAGGPTVTI